MYINLHTLKILEILHVLIWSWQINTNVWKHLSKLKTGLLDFHKTTTTVLKTYFHKQNPKLIVYRKHRNYDHLMFREEFLSKPKTEIFQDFLDFSTFLSPNLEFSCYIESKICSFKSSVFHKQRVTKSYHD